MDCQHEWGYIPGETPQPKHDHAYFSCLKCKNWGWRPFKGADRSIREFKNTKKRQEDAYWRFHEERERLLKQMRELDGNGLESEMDG